MFPSILCYYPASEARLGAKVDEAVVTTLSVIRGVRMRSKMAAGPRNTWAKPPTIFGGQASTHSRGIPTEFRLAGARYNAVCRALGRYAGTQCPSIRKMPVCTCSFLAGPCRQYFGPLVLSQAVRPFAKKIYGKAAMEMSQPQLYAYFLTRVRANLHIVLAFSPIGEAFRDRLRKFPSLINCCAIGEGTQNIHFSCLA